MYGQAVQIRVTGGVITHLTGVAWYSLPIPRRRHDCTPATVAVLGVMFPENFERCACGGWRVAHFGNPTADDWTPWRDRNSRRNGTAHNITLH